MNSGFTLRSALAIFAVYALVTILFLDGETRHDAGSPPPTAEQGPRLDLPDALPRGN